MPLLLNSWKVYKMIKRLSIIFVLLANVSVAQTPDFSIVVKTHIVPSYQRLADAATGLANEAELRCSPENQAFLDHYHDAFDAWVLTSHLRFGPSEKNDRAFALAFWPDPRSKTPKALNALIVSGDPVIDNLESFQTVSIAARGFYALEYLLFDPMFSNIGDTEYRCNLIKAITQDIAANTKAILQDWKRKYASVFLTPGPDQIYQSQAETTQVIFTALLTGLEFTANARLGRPMGTFERPRPNRAEARRSERSLRHIVLSLQSTRALTAILSNSDPKLDANFDRALGLADDLNDPVFLGVNTPQGRLRIEILQQSIMLARQALIDDLGPRLGISAGFNALDGD